MNLDEGEVIEQIEAAADDWWSGVGSGGKTGLFPANYVEIIESIEPGQGQAEEAAAPPPPPVTIITFLLQLVR
jgi:hypothetical protein